MLQNMFHLGSSKRSRAAFYGFMTGSYNTLAIPLPLRYHSEPLPKVLQFTYSPLLRIEVIAVITHIFDKAQRNIVIRNQHYTLLYPL